MQGNARDVFSKQILDRFRCDPGCTETPQCRVVTTLENETPRDPNKLFTVPAMDLADVT